MRRISLLFLTMTILSTIAGNAARKDGDDAPFWTGKPDAAAFRKTLDERLAKATEAIDRMLAAKGKRNVENTLKPYDEALVYLNAASSQAHLIEEVHPDAALRSAAEKASQKAQAFGTELSLNRAVYDALTSLDLKGADEQTRYYVEKSLRDFRLAGVDKDEATRKRIMMR